MRLLAVANPRDVAICPDEGIIEMTKPFRLMAVTGACLARSTTMGATSPSACRGSIAQGTVEYRQYRDTYNTGVVLRSGLPLAGLALAGPSFADRVVRSRATPDSPHSLHCTYWWSLR